MHAWLHLQNVFGSGSHGVMTCADTEWLEELLGFSIPLAVRLTENKRAAYLSKDGFLALPYVLAFCF